METTQTDVMESLEVCGCTSKEVESLKELIGETEPYYKLKNLRKENGSLLAEISIDLRQHIESNSISIGELGRHCAILGALAVADRNPIKEKHYYLSSEAQALRVYDASFYDDTFTISMQCIEFDRKSAASFGYLTNKKGERLFEVTVQYHVIHHRLFERRFDKYKQPTNFDLSINPYSEVTPLKNINLGFIESRASIDTISKESCSGHFENFPALTVARVVAILSNLIGLHYNNRIGGGENISVTLGIVCAHSFVFSGEPVELKCTSLEINDCPELGEAFICYASTPIKENFASLRYWIR